MHDQTRIIDLSLDLLREILNQKSHKQLEYMSALATPSRRERSLGSWEGHHPFIPSLKICQIL